MTTTFAMITARGGGSTFYRKNTYPLLGKPVIAWAIEACLRAQCVDQIFVWTEDKEIRSIAEKLGAHCLTRPKSMVHYHSGFHSAEEFNRNKYDQIQAIAGTQGDVHLSLNCNNLLIRPATLDAMFDVLMDNPNLGRILGVKAVDPDLCLINDKTGYLFPFWNDPDTKPVEYPPLFRAIGVNIAHRLRLEEGIRDTLHFPVSPEEGLDFQNEDDVALAEFYLMKRWGGRIETGDSG
ncbi:MAG: hypothetical protein JRF59_01500 [Deltaproteobacteria bacterium]|nr:hypothetical protein [Deltaproteobacteria bacterium]MBW1922256.1 hypothetical protein [Deltaproteobacteria bacterium]MBW1949531.1 hypothetical protein [Deltaproteobacteria bacterium]MBW2008418.1 hypothetical protein [Deltaproteobacteria bacterium]MBW2102180.1 hypothetical protein [Deltaproteobacteria bacterium]